MARRVGQSLQSASQFSSDSALAVHAVSPHRDLAAPYDGLLNREIGMPRIGMLTPSSNTVLEPVTAAILVGHPEITAHFSRFKVTEIALDAGALAQFDDSEILRAADLLAQAKVDIISWNGTSASWLGIERDMQLKSRIESTTGIKASTCILSLMDILKRLDARTQALVSPYTEDVQARITETYASHGITCPAERHLGIRDNFSFGTVSQATIRGMIEDCMIEAPDVVTILCTNMRGASLAPLLERASGPVILDSVAVTLWGCLMELGIRPDMIHGWGRVFSDPRLNPLA
jgi:maleate isomerase